MNIYIYGNNDFKQDIHEVLDHSNIKFKLDEYGSIIDIQTLNELKHTIENFPDYIYLIDESKIIKKGAFKLFNPKDGIEHAFLIEHGIEDVQIDSLDDIPSHITSRLDILESSINFGKEEINIQESIIEIVDEAYENDSVDVIEELGHSSVFPNTLDGLNSSFNSAFSKDTLKNENIAQIEEVIKEIDEKTVSLKENDELDNLLNSFDDENNDFSSNEMSDLMNNLDQSITQSESENYDDLISGLDDVILEDNKKKSLDIIEEEISSILNNDMNINNESMEGVRMASDFSSIDDLQESDMLSAFDSDVSININANSSNEIKAVATSTSNDEEKVSLNLDNVNDITALISKLLNNKTLEITIKVKN